MRLVLSRPRRDAISRPGAALSGVVAVAVVAATALTGCSAASGTLTRESTSPSSAATSPTTSERARPSGRHVLEIQRDTQRVDTGIGKADVTPVSAFATDSPGAGGTQPHYGEYVVVTFRLTAVGGSFRLDPRTIAIADASDDLHALSQTSGYQNALFEPDTVASGATRTFVAAFDVSGDPDGFVISARTKLVGWQIDSPTSAGA